jgi:signal transduction histidine kinase
VGSQELRTPITTIYAGSQMLLARRRLSEESQREMLADIQLEADRLYRLVEDLLVANVGKAGIEVVHEPILLQRSLPRVVAIEAARWPHVQFVTTLASELPAVRADELYVEHIVRDLLANAGSFSEHQATVRVDARQADDDVEVRVLDEGPGIEPEDAETLFQPFRGAKPEGGGRPGPGLGLYVCKLLVEAMDGTIWARARPAGGSEFGFSLPPYRDEVEDRRRAESLPAH